MPAPNPISQDGSRSSGESSCIAWADIGNAGAFVLQQEADPVGFDIGQHRPAPGMGNNIDLGFIEGDDHPLDDARIDGQLLQDLLYLARSIAGFLRSCLLPVQI